jgi:hypothetical protein
MVREVDTRVILFRTEYPYASLRWLTLSIPNCSYIVGAYKQLRKGNSSQVSSVSVLWVGIVCRELEPSRSECLEPLGDSSSSFLISFFSSGLSGRKSPRSGGGLHPP